MLSERARALTYVLAVTYAGLGALLFVAPFWAAPNFTWKVSPFVAMTMGGWCLGNAWAAFVVARRWHLSLVASGMIYLTLFAVLEAAVVITFSARVNASHWLAHLYLATIALNLIVSSAWAINYLTLRPALPVGDRFGVGGTVAGVSFVVFVGFLGIYGLYAPPGSIGLGASVFPEQLTPFTLRAFGAFYLSIALSPILLIVRRDLQMTLSHMLISWGFILFITAAAFIHFGQFDLASEPGQYVYFAAYLGVGLLTLFAMLRMGAGRIG